MAFSETTQIALDVALFGSLAFILCVLAENKKHTEGPAGMNVFTQTFGPSIHQDIQGQESHGLPQSEGLLYISLFRSTTRSSCEAPTISRGPCHEELKEMDKKVDQ